VSDERAKFYDLLPPSSSCLCVVSAAQKSEQPRSSYESKTRGENAQPLTRSANSTDVRSVRFNARRCSFHPNSDSVEIDATSRNFLRGDQGSDARSTSDGDRRLAGPGENYLVRASERPLPRKTVAT
jgi:hypothetical protein